MPTGASIAVGWNRFGQGSLALALKGYVHVGQVDVVAKRALTNLFALQGLPTIILVDRGKMTKYKAKRQLAAITAFARADAQDAAEPLPTWNDVSDDANKNKSAGAGGDYYRRQRLQRLLLLLQDPLPWLVVGCASPLSHIIHERPFSSHRRGIYLYTYTGEWATDDVIAFAAGGFQRSQPMTAWHNLRRRVLTNIAIVVQLHDDMFETIASTTTTTHNDTWLIALPRWTYRRRHSKLV
ncbi:hypothetical protein H257_04829 [Aphanomyces astaci]|uniref:Thioredoxin-like fold domain-containing protein n=1 Tax=Aphanomyces astaci TaxID=112090 RepID=W4GUY3_APHAT|nr:hypothetical protein H257_04829 [Aphanomyces astaci]ETV83101.1 hypothetical protein H257_04829 [Aphanomyces astaci]|eukprot:XP_009827772.1 hypothetical protein H257_04829 [Aphanomyces astaci]